MLLDKAYQGVSEDVVKAIFEFMPLYGEEVHLVVNTNSGIESSLDLAGKKVNMGEKLSGTFVTATGVLLTNKINIEDITPSYDLPMVALPKVISGEYDAMFVVGKAPIPYLATADCPTDTNVSGCIAGDPTTLTFFVPPYQMGF